MTTDLYRTAKEVTKCTEDTQEGATTDTETGATTDTKTGATTEVVT